MTLSIRTEVAPLLRKLDVHNMRDGMNMNMCSFDSRSEALKISSETKWFFHGFRVKPTRSVIRAEVDRPLNGRIENHIGGHSVVIHARKPNAVGRR